jgi:hypothetical protein
MRNKPLCSGIGQSHTDKYGRPYNSVTITDILTLAFNPISVTKENAVWFIPSTLHTREAVKQRENGVYCAVWCDIDTHTELGAIKDVLARLLCNYIVYSSRSATLECQKWRIIIPLSEPANPIEWQQLSQIFNDKFQAANIEPDRVSERLSQLCYLPNRGEFYQYYINQYAPIKWRESLKSELLEKQNQAIAEQQNIEQLREQSRLKATEQSKSVLSTGGATTVTNAICPIEAFNKSHSIYQILERNGFKQVHDRYIDPNSESGAAGITIIGVGDVCYCHHSNSVLNGTGTGAEKRLHDSFSLYKWLECGGDTRIAKAWNPAITKANQIAHMKAQDEATPRMDFSSMTVNKKKPNQLKTDSAFQCSVQLTPLIGLQADNAQIQ